MTVKEELLVEKIKNNYTGAPIQKSKFDELKALDKKVKMPTRIFGYTYGTMGSLVLGTGMCLAMKVIGNLMALGIVVGLLGITMVCTTYPLFKKILNKRKAKYADEIISKSNELLNEKQD